jgi:hypothetical protein
MEKYTMLGDLEIKERTVYNKIVEAQESSIRQQLELDFLKFFREKVKRCEITMIGSVYSDAQLDVLITNLTDCCAYEAERLNFYKSIRDDIIQKKVEEVVKNTPCELEQYPEKINSEDLVDLAKQK